MTECGKKADDPGISLWKASCCASLKTTPPPVNGKTAPYKDLFLSSMAFETLLFGKMSSFLKKSVRDLYRDRFGDSTYHQGVFDKRRTEPNVGDIFLSNRNWKSLAKLI